MPWQAVETVPFHVAADVGLARAAAIRAALLRRAVPLVRLLDGQLQPCATGSLIEDGVWTALLTAAHVFEHASVGDLAVPLPAENRIVALRSTPVRVVVHPVFDLALLWFENRSVCERLRASWTAFPLRNWWLEPAAASFIYVMAGYPSVNARRADGLMYAKPVIVFTRALGPGHFAYGRTAQRTDGLEIHTPELDGVSGATVWAIEEDAADGVACVLKPAAVQVAFHHSRHLRAEPISGARELIEHRH